MHFVPGISKYCHVIAVGVSGSIFVQSGRQPSKALSLPSSHCSPESTTPSPQPGGTSSPGGCDDPPHPYATTTTTQARLLIIGDLRRVHCPSCDRVESTCYAPMTRTARWRDLPPDGESSPRANARKLLELLGHGRH